MLKKLFVLLLVVVMSGNLATAAAASSIETQGTSVSPVKDFKKYFDPGIERLKQYNKIEQEKGLKDSKCHNPLSVEDKEIKTRLQEYLSAAAQYKNFHGTVLVEKDGKVIWEKAYGMANYEKGIPNRTSTRFAIASITKQFTAMAIMQLYERNKLKLDDKLSKFFPEFPRGDEITIHHLLTHTSGIVNYTNLPECWALQPDTVTEQDCIDLIIDKPLEFNPGEKWNYSNSGYLLLGVIVEKVSGKSFGEFLDKNIFKPLHMNNTGVCYKNDRLMVKTVGYVGYLDIEPIDDTLPFKSLYGAGNLYSTLDDLYRWEKALTTTKLVSKKTMDLIFTPHVDTKVAGYYGYGWMINGEDANQEIFHDGATLGFNSIISRFVNRNSTIIILSNNHYSGSGVYNIKRDINSILLGQDVKIPVERKPITLDIETLEKLVGTYEIVPGVNFMITREDNQLYAEVTGDVKAEIFPESETEFFYRVADAQITFIKDEQGQIIGLVLHQNGMDVGAMRIVQEEAA